MSTKEVSSSQPSTEAKRPFVASKAPKIHSLKGGAEVKNEQHKKKASSSSASKKDNMEDVSALAAVGDDKKRTKRKKSNAHNMDFGVGIKRLCKEINRLNNEQINPDDEKRHFGLKTTSEKVLNSMTLELCESFASKLSILLSNKKKETVKIDDVEHAVKLLFGANFSEAAIEYAGDAIARLIVFHEQKKDRKSAESEKPKVEGGAEEDKEKSTPLFVKADLSFDTSKVSKVVKHHLRNARIGQASKVFITACIEYVIAEVVRIAGNLVHARGKQRISPQYIQNALKSDRDLSVVFRNPIIFNVCEDQYDLQKAKEDAKKNSLAKKKAGGATNKKRKRVAAEDDGIDESVDHDGAAEVPETKRRKTAESDATAEH